MSAEEEAQRLLGRKPVEVNISKRNMKLLEKEAKRQGKTLQAFMDEIGEKALQRMFDAYDAVVKPQDGQHRRA